MKSLLDIQTAKELIEHVQIHGIPTDQESVVIMQDIIGHSTIEELSTLANDIGRNDENGNPDPKGSWSSGRKATQGTFYSLVFSIWNWEEAVRFWNQNTNPEHDEAVEFKARFQEKVKQNEDLTKDLKAEAEAKEQEAHKRYEAEQQILSLRIEAEKKDKEIMELKAKLYDLMMREEA